MFTRALSLASATIAAFITFTAPATAIVGVSPSDATRVVDVAGRQRMLSQRIVKSACLTTARIRFGANFSALNDAYMLFENSHDALLRGDENVNLVSTTVPEAVTALNRVEDRWETFSPLVDKIMSDGEISVVDLQRLDTFGLQVLTTMNEAVGTLGKVYAENLTDLTVGETITVDIAGRQRMLSQKMVKEACLFFVTGDNTASFAETISVFDASLNALIEGFPPAGVIAPPNADITFKLAEVKIIWDRVQPFVSSTRDGQTPTKDQLMQFAVEMDELLVTMNEAVGLYSQ